MAYVYFCYGVHHMLNIVTGPAGEASAVLIRSCEPVAGLDLVRRRRGGLEGPALLTGPGKVAQALAVDLSFTRHPLLRPGGPGTAGGHAPRAGSWRAPGWGWSSPREPDRLRPWRFALAGTPWVSQRKTLAPR